MKKPIQLTIIISIVFFIFIFIAGVVSFSILTSKKPVAPIKSKAASRTYRKSIIIPTKQKTILETPTIVYISPSSSKDVLSPTITIKEIAYSMNSYPTSVYYEVENNDETNVAQTTTKPTYVSIEKSFSLTSTLSVSPTYITNTEKSLPKAGNVNLILIITGISLFLIVAGFLL